MTLHSDWGHLRIRPVGPLVQALVFTAFGITLDKSRQGLVRGSERGRHGVPTLTVTNPGDFAARLLRDGNLGFGEAFIQQSWRGGDGTASLQAETDEIVDWLAVYAGKLASRGRWNEVASQLGWRWRMPRGVPNTRGGARRNVALHYDLPPDFFRLFLDEDLVYSCADFSRATRLKEAQRDKMDAILDLAEVREGATLLDIGCGWGGLLVSAATRRGAHATGITVSQRQFDYCRARITDIAGPGTATVDLADYRDQSGVYHSITSVEMIEAVGSAYWASYLRELESLLATDGAIALQLITFPDGRMEQQLGNYSWVDRYIFPGGELPSIPAIERILKRDTGLEITQLRRLSASYAKTLRMWRHRFCARLEEVRDQGFDDRFIRIWALYLAYFEAGFRVRYLDVWQCQIKRSADLA
ncbi:SAM-dependent methyltransferase [Paractinoplanes lichenicola]|uniref:Class I SAM-dependent methyltransferase n=1 Tax=Paractinoplanes lichenicola TaxID=2802976 RepID=A0ABS1VWE8_9ACTN|nr:cyclopropane-fatty-acyl-phospholipid synthase family protein [Actinoplanes lichenicola]MBL7258774.1 class I SAM-dependent methyltransferase [Actinoplanes lichenicola]